jgi:hypothetical protein
MRFLVLRACLLRVDANLLVSVGVLTVIYGDACRFWCLGGRIDEEKELLEAILI